MPKKLWITYAWKDNERQDIDFIAQELGQMGIAVKLDRWTLQSGKRLWEQIGNFITSPHESDGWLIVATQASLGSEPCKEELAYALSRALASRSASFPVIGLFLSSVDSSLIPPSISTRLHVSITDPDWKQRICSSLDNVPPAIARSNVTPYYLEVHKIEIPGNRPICIEVCPRAGTWAPFFIAIPSVEKEKCDIALIRGPRGRPSSSGVSHNCGDGPSNDSAWYCYFRGDEATPSQSYFIWCNAMPSSLYFGVQNGQPQYKVDFNQ